MRFITKNELNGFVFEESVLQSAVMQNGYIYIILDNVKIKPENSKNRDIITKRTNDLKVTIPTTTWRLFEEGYQLFDADLNPIETVEDREVAPDDIEHDLSLFSGCFVDEFRKEEDKYVLSFLVEDHTWRLEADGKEDTEAWDRFLNID